MRYLENVLSPVETYFSQFEEEFLPDCWKKEHKNDRWSPEKRWTDYCISFDEKTKWGKLIQPLTKLMVPNCSIKNSNFYDVCHPELKDGGGICTIYAFEKDQETYQRCISHLRRGKERLERNPSDKNIQISLKQGDILNYSGEPIDLFDFDLKLKIQKNSLSNPLKAHSILHVANLLERTAGKPYFITRFTFCSRPGKKTISENLFLLETFLEPDFSVLDHFEYRYLGNDGQGGPTSRSSMYRISMIWKRKR